MKNSMDAFVGFVEVTKDGYFIREDTGKLAAKVREVVAGELIPYYGEIKDGWFRVRHGWIANRAAKISDKPVLRFVVKDKACEMKSEPSKKSETIGAIEPKVKIVSAGESKGVWLKVITKNLTGWVSKNAIEAV